MSHNFSSIGNDTTIPTFWTLLQILSSTWKTVSFSPQTFELHIFKWVKLSNKYADLLIWPRKMIIEVKLLLHEELSYSISQFPKMRKLYFVIANKLHSVAKVGGVHCSYLCKAVQSLEFNYLLFIKLTTLIDSFKICFSFF